MDIERAALLLDALSHPLRLRITQFVIEAGPDGVASGRVSEELGKPPGTVSEHLAKLLAVQVVRVERKGRQKLYYGQKEEISAIIIFLQNIIKINPNIKSTFSGIMRRTTSPLPPNTRKRLLFKNKF